MFNFFLASPPPLINLNNEILDLISYFSLLASQKAAKRSIDVRLNHEDTESEMEIFQRNKKFVDVDRELIGSSYKKTPENQRDIVSFDGILKCSKFTSWIYWL